MPINLLHVDSDYKRRLIHLFITAITIRGRNMSIVNYIRLGYTTVAFAGAILLQTCPGIPATVFAAMRQPVTDIFRLDQDSFRNDYVQGKLEDQHKAIDAQSDRMNQLSDKVSTMQGVGIGITSALGGLQLLSIFASIKFEKKERKE